MHVIVNCLSGEQKWSTKNFLRWHIFRYICIRSTFKRQVCSQEYYLFNDTFALLVDATVSLTHQEEKYFFKHIVAVLREILNSYSTIFCACHFSEICNIFFYYSEMPQKAHTLNTTVCRPVRLNFQTDSVIRMIESVQVYVSYDKPTSSVHIGHR